MIKAEIVTDLSTVRVHDEFFCRDIDAVMPRLSSIVSASYQRRLGQHLSDPRQKIR